MFGKTVAPVIQPAEVPTAVGMLEDPVPLSVLSLDLDAPGEGWINYLYRRQIKILTDDLGRASITRSDAKQLFDEHRANEQRQAELRAERERQAIEADQRFRAGLNKGVEWWRLPDGTAPGDAMALAAAQANRRKSMQEELLEQEFGGSQSSMVYQPYPTDEAEAS